jgi:hypothetical protein
MPEINARINKRHKSLLDRDSNLDTGGEDDIQIRSDKVIEKILTTNMMNFKTTTNSQNL